jgi:hypothetical protein
MVIPPPANIPRARRYASHEIAISLCCTQRFDVRRMFRGGPGRTNAGAGEGHSCPGYFRTTDRRRAGYPTRIEENVLRSLNIREGTRRPGGGDLVPSGGPEAGPDHRTIIALAESFPNCVPRNLAAIAGRKVLVGNARHGSAPPQV